MCTVTFIARQRGYLLGMNRDEKLTRAKGLPPRLHQVNGVKVLSPAEPGGGTWIALNETGATLALINWYSVTARVAHRAISRGEVINACRQATSGAEAAAALGQLPLERINPFRLIGVFLSDRRVIEWRWNLHKLARIESAWRSRQWVSSGFDEPKAQRSRGKIFRHACQQSSAGSITWLRRLHRSHAPGIGPFSTCMHRPDAMTVSYTEITVRSLHSQMRYHSGAACDRHVPQCACSLGLR